MSLRAHRRRYRDNVFENFDTPSAKHLHKSPTTTDTHTIYIAHRVATIKQGAGSSGSISNAAPPPHLEDHWAARPTQQRAILMRLFQWKAESVGKEVVLLAGAGLSEGCVAAETRLEYKLLVPLPEEEQKDKERGKKVGGGGEKGRGKKSEREEEEEQEEQGEKKPKKPKRSLIGIEQVGVGYRANRLRRAEKLRTCHTKSHSSLPTMPSHSQEST